MICIPIGFYMASKYARKERAGLESFDARSGQGDNSEVPEEIKGWNWGAAGLGWVWGIYHGVWLSLLAFVPFVGFFWWIVMGLKGNEWAWQSGKWQSVEAFQASQRKWKIWGILFLIVGFLLGFVGAMINIIASASYYY
jgi:hypothetical protein